GRGAAGRRIAHQSADPGLSHRTVRPAALQPGARAAARRRSGRARSLLDRRAAAVKCGMLPRFLTSLAAATLAFVAPAAAQVKCAEELAPVDRDAEARMTAMDFVREVSAKEI